MNTDISSMVAYLTKHYNNKLDQKQKVLNESQVSSHSNVSTEIYIQYPFNAQARSCSPLNNVCTMNAPCSLCKHPTLHALSCKRKLSGKT